MTAPIILTLWLTAATIGALGFGRMIRAADLRDQHARQREAGELADSVGLGGGAIIQIHESEVGDA
jgi:hypothetical protein